MLRNLKVRTKLLFIVGVVAALFGATVVGLGMVAQRHVVASVQTELERSRQIISEFVESRWRQLNAGLKSLVDSPEIRAVLTTEGMDHDTQLMSITDLQHMLGADAVLFCDGNGMTLARTDDPFDEKTNVADISMIRQALNGTTAKGFWVLGDQPLLAMAFPVKQDDLVKGVVLAGVSIRSDGDSLRSLLLRDVAVAHDGDILMTSLPNDAVGGLNSLLQRPPTKANSMSDVMTLPREVTPARGGEKVETLATVVGFRPTDNESIQAAVFVPVSSVFGFYQDFRRVLLILGAVTIGLSVAITFKIGKILADQVQKTLAALEHVAAGDLTTRLDIQSRDEFGAIANALNTAIQASANTLDALAVRNRDTRMLLDAVEQGFFTIDQAGVMSDERSGAVDRMLASPEPGMTFPDFIRQFDEKVAGWLEMGLEDVFAEILPVEVTLDQLPARFKANGRTFAIECTPVRIDGQLRKLAVVLSDVTAEVENEQLEAEQRELTAIVQGISEDRSGFLEFFHESEDTLEALRSGSKDDLATVKRGVHTLKGNAGIFGLERVAAACHTIEDHIAETSQRPEDASWTSLYGRWASVRGYVRRIIGDKQQGIDLPEHEYVEFLTGLLRDAPKDELAIRMASWRLEPTARRMARVADQARALALRLGKGNILVRTRGGGLSIDSKHWSDFWSALVHVVRNAVDHGLESAEDRLMTGKSAAGSIDIGTTVQDGSFVVTIADDGRGINWERIAAAAGGRNLPANEPRQLIDALFIDGLSTAECVTQTSGRGVGMGAVRASCDRLGGRIDVESEPGVGTTFRFSFPLSAMAPEMIDLLDSHGVDRPERTCLGPEDAGGDSARSGQMSRHDARTSH